MQKWIDFWRNGNFSSEKVSKMNMEIFIKATDPILGYDKEDIVLDIGSGFGYLASFLKHRVREIHCLDISEWFLGLYMKRFAHEKNVFSYKLDSENYTDLSIVRDKEFSKIICLSVIQYYKNIQDPMKRKLAERFILLVGFALPLHVIDTVLENYTSAIAFYPLIYWGCCVIFSYYFMTGYLRPLKFPDSQKPSEPKPEYFQTSRQFAEDMLVQYNLSAREQDILPLILKGLSNTDIGETLCISVSTVKTHITNIYTKFDVKSRYELITLFHKLHFLQEPQENEK